MTGIIDAFQNDCNFNQVYKYPCITLGSVKCTVKDDPQVNFNNTLLTLKYITNSFDQGTTYHIVQNFGGVNFWWMKLHNCGKIWDKNLSVTVVTVITTLHINATLVYKIYCHTSIQDLQPGKCNSCYYNCYCYIYCYTYHSAAKILPCDL